MLKGRFLRHKLEIVPYYAVLTFILCLMEKKKTTKGEDGIAVNFGMPVVISNLTNDWCKINSIFNAPIGYIPIQDIEIIK